MCLWLLLWGDCRRRSAAQVGAGALTGDVSDQAGAAVPGATVTVTSVGTNLSRTSMTGPDGRYAVPGLAPGSYQVRVELSGFRPLTREGIRLATGETVRLDLQLEVGGLAEAITVTADAPLLRSETSGLGQVIDNRKVVDLPLNGRSFITLASLAPGVALPPGSPLPRINGGRPRTNEYLFDGISVLQPEPGQVAFFPNIDAIQEFKIESNSPPAEFGRFNGGVVNLTTKAGSNAFRGSVFEFFRNEALNARNFFASTNPVKPQFRRNQFGGVIGGPIRQNRTFFFADYQGQRQTIGRTVISTVPTLLQRQGVFTEAIGGRVPVIYDPATTVLGPTGGATRSPFPGNAIPVGADGSGRPRAAAAISAADERRHRQQLPAGGRRDRQSGSVQPANRPSFRDEPGSGLRTSDPIPGRVHPGDAAAGWQRRDHWNARSAGHDLLVIRLQLPADVLGSLLNELRIGDTRRTVGRTAAQLSGAASTSLGLPGIPSNARFPNTLPTFLIAGYQQLGSPPNTATDFGTSVTQIADSLTWLKGRHTLKVGADLRWERLNVVQPPSPTGSFTFSSLFTDLPGRANTGTPLASFLLGQVQQFSIDLQQEQIRNRAHFQEYFIQDDWRVSDRITVNGGVRYTLNFPSTEENNQAAVFNLRNPATRISRTGWPAASGPPAPQAQLRSASRHRRTCDGQDRGPDRLRDGLDRAGRDHDALHDAGLSVPADGVPAHARQHRPGLRPRRRASRRADSADAECRPGTGRVCRGPRPRVGLRAAVECVRFSAS